MLQPYDMPGTLRYDEAISNRIEAGAEAIPEAKGAR